MLQACLNGGRTEADVPGVPVTPAALASAAASVRAAGADEFHVHPRDDTGAESLHPDDVGAALDAVRAAVPGCPVGIGTGAWITPGGIRRHPLIEAWVTTPDYASLNLFEPDAAEVADLLSGHGVKIEAGVYSTEDVTRLMTVIRPARCCRVLVEISEMPATEARDLAREIILALGEARPGLPILLHGSGKSAWPILRLAAELGLSARAGFEDMIHLPNGQRADDNVQIIHAAREIMGA